jgi:DNA polymerase
MKLYALDFETYFDEEFSLRKMTTEEYIRDPRFEIHGAAVVGDPSTGAQELREWMTPKQLKEQCEHWRNTSASGGESIALVAHHAHFDGLILNMYLDYRPDVWLDTLSMGRVVFGSGLRLGLEHLANYFQLTPKNVPYSLFKGKHWSQIPSHDQNQIAQGSLHDAELTLQCVQYMLNGGHPAIKYCFPPAEIPVVDLTVRMFTEPSLVGDLDMLGAAWLAERRMTEEAIEHTEMAGRYRDYDEALKALRIDIDFARALRSLGIDVDNEGRKITSAGNEKYAFAKSDYFMQDLLEHPNDDVVFLAQARLKAHSSIYTTRTERFGFMSTRGPLPIYLAYAAAHTRRWGGGDKQNAQNFPRPDPYRPHKGALRRAIKAP